jgi:hypothetical protein
VILLLSRGVPVKVASEMLGSGDVAITLAVYQSVLPHVQESAGGRGRRSWTTLVGASWGPDFRYHGHHTKNPKERRSMAYLEGQLRGDMVGAGGEHTGYVLEVEVDMSAVQNAQEIVGEQVAVTGEVEIVDYPERGKVLIFRATSAAAIEEVEETEETEEVE